MPFAIGAPARCSDGVCGRVTQVVLDPVKDEITHLVVEPENRQGLGRLVPIEEVEAHADGLDLGLTRAEFEELPVAEEVRFLPGTEGYPGYDADQSLLWPYFGGNSTEPVVVDSLPVGEVAVQRGENVFATDGRVGDVEGLILDQPTHRVTHILLKKGHLFGHEDVAIPIGSVNSVDTDGVRLSISKQEVGHLPTVGYQHRST
jgi:sporulation protein YlmC with PRC-barrel domain